MRVYNIKVKVLDDSADGADKLIRNIATSVQPQTLGEHLEAKLNKELCNLHLMAETFTVTVDVLKI